MIQHKVRIKGLSDYLDGKSVNTIYKLVEENRIPFERVGRDLFFDLKRVDEWMRREGNGDALMAKA